MKLLVQYHTSEIERICSLGLYNKPGDAGLDLHNAGRDVLIPYKKFAKIPSGISIKIPEGCVGLVTARSSAFTKKGLAVIPGVIDSGYVGPLFTQIWNIAGENGTVVKKWDRVSQVLVIPFVSPEIVSVQDLPITERGINGFGSTGS